MKRILAALAAGLLLFASAADAQVTINNLPAATVPLTGGEVIPLWQGIKTVNATVRQVRATYAGITAPSSPATYDLWIDDSGSVATLKQWDSTSWVPIGSLDPAAHAWTPSLGSAASNTVLAGPTSGSPAAPTYRALIGTDLPNPSSSSLGGVQSKVTASHQFLTGISTSGVPSAAQPSTSDISGISSYAQLGQIQTFTAAQSFNAGISLNGSTSGSLLLKTPSVAGSNTVTFPAGTTDFSATGGAHQYVQQSSAGGAFSVGQPSTSDMSDAANIGLLNAAKTWTSKQTFSSCINLGNQDFCSYKELSWTPTDASGGGVSLTGVTATYTQVGNYIMASANLTYGSNASGASAKIGGLPVAASSNDDHGCTVTWTNAGSTLAYSIVAPGTSTISLFNSSGSAPTNTSLAGKSVYLNCAYSTTN